VRAQRLRGRRALLDEDVADLDGAGAVVHDGPDLVRSHGAHDRGCVDKASKSLDAFVVDPDEDVLETTDPAQLKALAHPLRNRILFGLGADGATVSQLATRLRTHKGNVAHHLAVLEKAGLVRRGHTRQVRGGTEQYFTRVARRLRTPSRGEGQTAALLQAVAEEVDQSPTEALLNLRRVRLTRQQASALVAHLERVVDGLPEADPAEPTFGVLVSVFQSRGARH
jgi:DNA-binding transcriptional ArsR family regulator